MSDRFHPVCGHHGDYVMGIGDNMYCGICKIERQAKQIADLQAVAEAARYSNKYLQAVLERHEGSDQFDFSPEPYDLYWYHQQRKALAKLDKP